MTGTDNRDPYAILDVAPNATQETINAAYRKLVRLYHPDVNPSPGATAKMQDINWARALLNDSAKRRQYDLQRAIQQRRPKARPAGPQPPPYTRYYQPPGQPARTNNTGEPPRPPRDEPRAQPKGYQWAPPPDRQRSQQERQRAQQDQQRAQQGQQRAQQGQQRSQQTSWQTNTDWRGGDTGAWTRTPPHGEEWARPTGRYTGDTGAWRPVNETGRQRPADARRSSRPPWERATGSTAWDRSARRDPFATPPPRRSSRPATARPANGRPVGARPIPNEPDVFAAVWDTLRMGWTWLASLMQAPASALSLGVAVVGVVIFVLVFALRGSSDSGGAVESLRESPVVTPTSVFVAQGAQTLEGQWIDIWGEAYRKGIQQLVDASGWTIQVRLGDRVFVNARNRSDAYYCRTPAFGSGLDPTPVPPATLEGCIPIKLPSYLGGQDG